MHITGRAPAYEFHPFFVITAFEHFPVQAEIREQVLQPLILVLQLP